MDILEKISDVLYIWKIKDLWYYYSCKFFHPYNVIKIKSLEPTWQDKCELIREATFQLLVEFVEKEKPLEHTNWDSDPGHSNARDIFVGAYDYIKIHRPKLVELESYTLHEWSKAIGPMKWGPYKGDEPEYEGNNEFTGFQNNKSELSEILFHAHSGIEEAITAIDTQVLTDIIKIRDYLWT